MTKPSFKGSILSHGPVKDMVDSKLEPLINRKNFKIMLNAEKNEWNITTANKPRGNH